MVSLFSLGRVDSYSWDGAWRSRFRNSLWNVALSNIWLIAVTWIPILAGLECLSFSDRV